MWPLHGLSPRPLNNRRAAVLLFSHQQKATCTAGRYISPSDQCQFPVRVCPVRQIAPSPAQDPREHPLSQISPKSEDSPQVQPPISVPVKPSSVAIAVTETAVSWQAPGRHHWCDGQGPGGFPLLAIKVEGQLKAVDARLGNLRRAPEAIRAARAKDLPNADLIEHVVDEARQNPAL